MGLKLKLEMFFEKRRREKAEKLAREGEMNRIRHQAKLEAMEELKPILKEKYKEDIKRKLTGEDKEIKRQKRREVFEKLAKDFKESKIGSRDSVDYMLGNNSNSRIDNDYSRLNSSRPVVREDVQLNDTSSIPSSDRIARMLSGRRDEDRDAKKEKDRILNLLK